MTTQKPTSDDDHDQDLEPTELEQVSGGAAPVPMGYPPGSVDTKPKPPNPGPMPPHYQAPTTAGPGKS